MSDFPLEYDLRWPISKRPMTITDWLYQCKRRGLTVYVNNQENYLWADYPKYEQKQEPQHQRLSEIETDEQLSLI